VNESAQRKLRRIESQVERQIRELRDARGLSGLPGEGSPLPHDPDAGAGDAWAARHLARAARATSLWADLRDEIADRRARLLARLRAHDAWLARRAALEHRVPAERIVSERERTRAADRRVLAEVAASLAELNELVRRHNLLVSAASLHLPIVTLDGLRAAARATER
jgi:hypothetical protein